MRRSLEPPGVCLEPLASVSSPWRLKGCRRQRRCARGALRAKRPSLRHRFLVHRTSQIVASTASESSAFFAFTWRRCGHVVARISSRSAGVVWPCCGRGSRWPPTPPVLTCVELRDERLDWLGLLKGLVAAVDRATFGRWELKNSCGDHLGLGIACCVENAATDLEKYSLAMSLL